LFLFHISFGWSGKGLAGISEDRWGFLNFNWIEWRRKEREKVVERKLNVRLKVDGVN
jgi:hypothetical protein